MVVHYRHGSSKVEDSSQALVESNTKVRETSPSTVSYVCNFLEETEP